MSRIPVMPAPLPMVLRIALPGALWGTLVAAMEAVRLPVVDEGVPTFLAVLASQVAVWSIVGIALAALVETAGDRISGPRRFTAFVLVSSSVLSLLASAIFAWGPAWTSFAPDGTFPRGRDATGAFLYQAWIVAFYGGLYAFAHMLLGRAERQRASLARARDAWMRSEAALADARLMALRGHVDPALLLRVLREVERRYAASPADGDRLLRRLVAFLRLAMPGVRSGRSTLAAELDLLREHGSLVEGLDPGTAMRVALPPEAPRTAFPSLLLLPIVERFAAASPQSAPVRVSLAHAGDRSELILERDGKVRADWLSPDLGARIRVAMSGVFGVDWSMRTEDVPTGSRFMLGFPSSAGAVASPPQETTCPTPIPTSFAVP